MKPEEFRGYYQQVVQALYHPEQVQEQQRSLAHVSQLYDMLAQAKVLKR